MADPSSDGAYRPGPDLALSSDEEDFVSSQSTASVEDDAQDKMHLAAELRKAHLEATELSQSSDQCKTGKRVSNLKTGDSVHITSNKKPDRSPLQLLGLPLDILKEIIKEVRFSEMKLNHSSV